MRAAAALSGGKRSGGSISHTRKTKIDLVEGPYPMAVKVKHIESGGASQKAELCLLPCEYQLQPAKLLDLVKNTWRLELPNLIVACDIGSAHPLQLGTTMLAELPPIYGLYAALAPLPVYAAMGSSRHMSIGPFALVSLLVADAAGDVVDPDADGMEAYIDAVMCLSMMVGTFLLLMFVVFVGPTLMIATGFFANLSMRGLNNSFAGFLAPTGDGP